MIHVSLMKMDTPLDNYAVIYSWNQSVLSQRVVVKFLALGNNWGHFDRTSFQTFEPLCSIKTIFRR